VEFRLIIESLENIQAFYNLENEKLFNVEFRLITELLKNIQHTFFNLKNENVL